LTTTHTSGDTIQASQPSIADNNGGSIEPFSDDVTAGDSVTFAAGADDTVRVIWESDDGETTDTLAE
jgi:hypothetical protein